jgi:thiol-disulfide isomerase/thioredoxin
MKIRTLALAGICTTFLLSCTNEKIIKLPLLEIKGYGPFQSAMGGVSPYPEDENNPWRVTQLKVSGIPNTWMDAKVGDIDTDIYQTVYQNYFLGNISEERFIELQNAWNWKPDSINLSQKPLKSKIAFAFGKDSIGMLKMIVDANNNLDLSDDEVFTPIEVDPNNNLPNDSLALSNTIEVAFERFLNNKITKVKAPLLITHMSQFNMFMSNFAQYATAKLNGEEIAIRSDNFTNLSYKNPSIVNIDNSLKEKDKIGNENVVEINEYIEIKDNIYKNLGVNKNENVLVLERVELPKQQLFSTQVGFNAYDFFGDDFKTGAPISLDDLKGKYVFLDFWATWCGPCIQEIPNLNGLYEKMDSSKFEIISIVGDSTSESLDKMIEKHSILWPQVLSNDINRIKEEYGIKGYPTTFLLNPDGVIIAKNLRGKELENKVTNLIN